MSDLASKDNTSSHVTDANSDTEPDVESFHDALETLVLGGESRDNTVLDNTDHTGDDVVTPGDQTWDHAVIPGDHGDDHVVIPGDNNCNNVSGTSSSGGLETPKDNSESDDIMKEAEENYIMTDSDSEEMAEVTVDEQAILDRESQMTLEEKQELRDAAQRLKEEGNILYKASEFTRAVKTYSEALETCPRCFQKERSIMFSNRAAAQLRLEKHETAIADCSEAIKLNPTYLKAIIRRAELYEKTDKLDEALEDYKKTLELDPSQHAARFACMRLPDQIKERNEKLKDEMLGKLKELGNMVLKPFGLSTNNFQLQQDPSTGSYSVNFSQGGKS